MIVGYARISTTDQKLDLQTDALTKAGCEKIFSDCITGLKNDRVGLAEAINFVRPGDVLVVWKLDRLGRSLSHLISTVQGLTERNVEFKSLQEGMDTTTPSGKLLFHLFGSFAEFERDLIRERTMAGLAAARARGRLGGSAKLLSPAKIKMGKQLALDRNMSVKEICDALGCSPATYYRHIKN